MEKTLFNRSSLTQTFSTFALTALLGSALALTPALASGGKVVGGGATGGGGSVKSGGTADSTSTVVPLDSYGLIYNGLTPTGSATLGYAADGSAQSLSISVKNVNVPDGSVLPVRVIIGKLESIFTYYQTTQVVYHEVDGTISVKSKSASLNLSTLNGDVVPDFPGPAPAGTTEIQVLSPDGSTVLLDGLTGGFHV